MSPQERKRLRIAFRNERNLYHRTCALSGQPIISAFSPDKTIPVYSPYAPSRPEVIYGERAFAELLS